MERARIEFSYYPLDEVLRWPKNPKAHDFKELEESLKRWGYTEAVLRDTTSGMIVAGNGRIELLESLYKAGATRPEFIDVDAQGRWLVPVTSRPFRSEDEAVAYLLASNEIGRRAGWDAGLLHETASRLLSRGVSFKGTGFDPEALMKAARAALPASTPPPAPADNGIDESRPQPVADPVTRTGDVWICGSHRVLCADSFDPETPGKLLAGKKPAMVATDPPYAIFGSSTGIGRDIADDRMIVPFFESVLKLCRVLPYFAHAYVNCDWRSWPAFCYAARRTAFTVKNCLIWDKGDGGLGSMYGGCHEFVGFVVPEPPPLATSMRGKGSKETITGHRTVMRPNILRFPRVTGDERLHNAAKPKEMIREFIRNSSDPGEIVVDFFGGSGTTLVAAEAEGRACYIVEEAPGWVEVIVRRWERLTGKTAERISAGTPKVRRRAP